MTDLTTISLINGGSAGESKVDSKEKVAEISTYADYLSLPTSFDEQFFADTVSAGRDAGMGIHAWVADDDAELYSRLVDLKIDATFTNNVAFAEGVLSVIDPAKDDLNDQGNGPWWKPSSEESPSSYSGLAVLVAAVCSGIAVGGVAAVSLMMKRGGGKGGVRELTESDDETLRNTERLSEAPQADVLRYF